MDIRWRQKPVKFPLIQFCHTLPPSQNGSTACDRGVPIGGGGSPGVCSRGWGPRGGHARHRGPPPLGSLPRTAAARDSHLIPSQWRSWSSSRQQTLPVALSHRHELLFALLQLQNFYRTLQVRNLYDCSTDWASSSNPADWVFTAFWSGTIWVAHQHNVPVFYSGWETTKKSTFGNILRIRIHNFGWFII